MLRRGQTTAYALTVLMILAGCSNSDKKQPPIDDVKLGDLAPIRPIGPIRSIGTVAFDFYTIELPSENIDRLSDIWPMLYTKPVRLTNPAAFAANSLQLVFGEPQMWPNIATFLESAGARLAGKTRLLLDYGQTDEFLITRINAKTDVTYLTPHSTVTSLTAQPGRFVFKVQVSPVAGARGLCDFNAKPVIIPARSSTTNEDPTKMEDVVFETLGFSVEMSPGDFYLLGPAHFPSSANSFNSLLFTTAKYKKILVYAVFCSGIID